MVEYSPCCSLPWTSQKYTGTFPFSVLWPTLRINLPKKWFVYRQLNCCTNFEEKPQFTLTRDTARLITRPGACLVIWVSDIICVVSPIVSFSNHRLCLERQRVSQLSLCTQVCNWVGTNIFSRREQQNLPLLDATKNGMSSG